MFLFWGCVFCFFFGGENPWGFGSCFPPPLPPLLFFFSSFSSSLSSSFSRGWPGFPFLSACCLPSGHRPDETGRCCLLCSCVPLSSRPVSFSLCPGRLLSPFFLFFSSFFLSFFLLLFFRSRFFSFFLSFVSFFLRVSFVFFAFACACVLVLSQRVVSQQGCRGLSFRLQFRLLFQGFPFLLF